MIIHGAGTCGFFELVYFLTAEACCVLAVLIMLLHDANFFSKGQSSDHHGSCVAKIHDWRHSAMSFLVLSRSLVHLAN